MFELEALGHDETDLLRELIERGVQVEMEGTLEDFVTVRSIVGFTKVVDKEIREHFKTIPPPSAQQSLFETRGSAKKQVVEDPEIAKLRKFLYEMWDFNRCSAWWVVKALNESGADIVGEPGLEQYVELYEIKKCIGLTEQRIDIVRELMVKESEREPCDFFPTPGFHSRETRNELDQLKATDLINRRIVMAEQKAKGKLKEMREQENDAMDTEEEEMDLTEEWTRLSNLCKSNGFPDNYIQDMLARTCQKLDVELGLTRMTILALEAELIKEFELKNLKRASESAAPPPVKAEAPKQEAPSKEKADAIAQEVFGGTADDAKPKQKRAKKGDEGAKENPTNPIENILVTNRSTGEVKTFNAVTKSWFDLQIKKETIEIEMEHYVAQCKARLKEVEDNEAGWHYCYDGGVSDAVREQFAKQRKDDGTYKPATVKTEYCTFTRDPEDQVQIVDKGRLQAQIENVPEEQRIFWGDVIKVEVKCDKKELVKAVLRGDLDVADLNGVVKLEQADPVGTPKMSLTKPKNSAKSEENSDGNLGLVQTNNDSEAA